MKKLRKATSKDMKIVYMMGYDVWGNNMSPKEYLVMCQGSSKYKLGQWYVLEETEKKELLCSLIVYELNSSEDVSVKGIGSISTPPHLRQKGYATILVKETMNELEKYNDCTDLFLYSDIGSHFYEKMNFIKITDSKQKYKDSICMYYSKENSIDSVSFEIPNYF